MGTYVAVCVFDAKTRFWGRGRPDTWPSDGGLDFWPKNAISRNELGIASAMPVSGCAHPGIGPASRSAFPQVSVAGRRHTAFGVRPLVQPPQGIVGILGVVDRAPNPACYSLVISMVSPEFRPPPEKENSILSYSRYRLKLILRADPAKRPLRSAPCEAPPNRNP